MRLSIDITPEQHQFLKAAAAIQGKSISKNCKFNLIKSELKNLFPRDIQKIYQTFILSERKNITLALALP